MRKLLITLDDYCAKELANYPNQSETLREAFRIYNGNISTDTLAGIRQAFTQLLASHKKLEERFNEQYEIVEKAYDILEEFKNR